MAEKQSSTSNHKLAWWEWLLIVLAVLLVAAVYASWSYWLRNHGREVGNFGGVGTLGDAYGVINALFSGFALVGIAITVILTRRQLAMQAAEISDQKRADAKRAVQDQFFQMLASWQTVAQQVVATADTIQGRVTLQGHAALSELGRTLALHMRIKHVGPEESDVEARRRLVTAVMDREIGNRESELGHYFRLLYHIVRFIVSTPDTLMNKDEKQNLIRIVRAHFSGPEFVLIFYNGVHPNGDEFDKLIDDYDLVQNMKPQDVGQPIDLEFYPQTKQRWALSGKVVPTR